MAQASSPASSGGVPPPVRAASPGGTPDKPAGEDARATLATALANPLPLIRMNSRATAAALLLMTLSALAAPEAEFIRVAPDHWRFETSVSRTPFVPFGANFVLSDKRYLNPFGPGSTTRRGSSTVLAALEGLGFNTLKVFLAHWASAARPQVPGEARIAPGYLDNLEDFLRLAGRHHIRVVVCLACWGGSELKWWHEGGEYFGRHPWQRGRGH